MPNQNIDYAGVDHPEVSDTNAPGSGDSRLRNNNPSELGQEASDWLKAHLEVIEGRIVNEAQARARDAQHRSIEPSDVSLAAMKYAPGRAFPEDRELTLGERIGMSISGITLISAVLAVLFGAMGAIQAGEGDATAWYDIAKIFAGAVVGSTGAAAVASARKR